MRSLFSKFILAAAALPPLIAAAGEGERYAFLVGVSAYRSDSGLNNLRFAEGDMTALKTALIDAGFKDRNIRLMVKSNPDERFNPRLDNIKKELRLLLDAKRPEDVVVVAFAGHGLQYREKDSVFFCPSDANVMDIKTWLDLSEVLAQLKECGAGGKLLIADCCRDDPRLRNVRALPDNVQSVTRPQAMKTPESVAAIFSCRNGEFAHEEEEFKGGVFTHFLIQGLKGEAALNGEVEIKVLASYLERNVYDYVSAKRGVSQRPACRVENDRPLVLARIKTQESPAETARKQALFDAKMAEFDETMKTNNQKRMEEVFDEASKIWPENEQPPAVKEKLTKTMMNMALRIVTTNRPRVGLEKLPKKPWESGEIKNLPNPKALFKTLTLDVGLVRNIELVQIRAGTFQMGSPQSEPAHLSHEYRHDVTISKDFFIGKFEITQEQWQAVMGNNPSRVQNPRHPVDNISWDDAQAFCRKLSAKTGKPVRLPTEAQWEYACRAGTETPFNTGERLSTNEANFNGDYTYNGSEKGLNRKSMTPVGTFASNAWGVFDMHGNAYEWCEDYYDDKYFEKSPKADPRGPATGTKRVMKGGSWAFDPFESRSASRYGDDPATKRFDGGFRVVVEQ